MKKTTLIVAAALVALSLTAAEMITFTPEQMIRYTPKNPYERFPDGRPKVPDALLERVRALSLEDVFSTLQRYGFKNQYEGGWQILNAERKLVGRAVTAQYLPYRPDAFAVSEGPAEEAADAKAGFTGHGNGYRRMVDVLQGGDVLVVDMFGDMNAGAPVGDNLATAIYAATGNNGFVMNGAVRDAPGIGELAAAVFFWGRGIRKVRRGDLIAGPAILIALCIVLIIMTNGRALYDIAADLVIVFGVATLAMTPLARPGSKFPRWNVIAVGAIAIVMGLWLSILM